MSKVKNIVMIIPNDKEPKCGGDMYFYELIKYFTKRNSKPVIIGFNSIPNKVKKYKIICNLWFFFSIIGKKKAIIIQDGYFRDYLLFCNILVKIFTKSKIIIFFQDMRRFNVSGTVFRRVQAKVVLRLFLKTSDIVIGNSEYLKREIVSERYPVSRVYTIPPAYQNLTKQIDNKQNKKDGQIILLCVGNYREIKGQKHLIEALKIINNPKVSLYLAGSPDRDFPYYLNMKDQVIKNNLGKQVFFTGWLIGDDLARMYLLADIFVLPSLYEAFGMVLLEAMSYKLPIVASNIGGIPEIVRDGENGFLCLPSNPNSLASALQKLIKSKEARVKIGMRGNEMVKTFSSWESVCSKFHEIVNGTIE